MQTNLASSSVDPDSGNTIIFIPSGMKMQTNLASSSEGAGGGYTIIPLPGRGGECNKICLTASHVTGNPQNTDPDR